MSKFFSFLKQANVLSKWRRWREHLEDLKQNRELIGIDRFNNKYYQYYSFLGLPTRREVRFKNELDFAMKDLVYYQWLHHQVFDPPTESEKEKYYLEEKIRFENALANDRKVQMEMVEFRRRRQELLLRDQATRELEKELKGKQKLIDIQTKRQNQEK